MHVKHGAASSLLVLALALLECQALASNGTFDAPGIESYRKLPLSEHRQYRRAARQLLKPDFMEVRIAVTNDPRYIGPSYYATPDGRAELQTIGAAMLRAGSRYGDIVFVGRSGAGIKAYLEGVLAERGTKGPVLREIPYSCNEPALLTAAQKQALRGHLVANGLSPQQLLAAEKPVMLMDFVYSGTGVNSLVKQIHDWAREEGISKEALKPKLGFFGAYPAQMLVRNNLMKLNHDSLREGQPIRITDEIVAQEARGRSLPNKWHMLDWMHEVHELQISEKLYDYAGNLTAHPNKSFTPAKWENAVDRSVRPGFEGHSSEIAYIELYYLISEGYKESKTMLKRAGCEAALLVR